MTNKLSPAHTHSPAHAPSRHIAVIGAGIAGMACARTLAQAEAMLEAVLKRLAALEGKLG